MRRPERLAETLKEQIAEVVGFELDDPRLGSVTVTDVELAKDLRDARVYVFVRGSEQEITAALSALRNASGFVRRQVALDLDLRHAPHLHFVRDTAEENAQRVHELLKDIEIAPEFDEAG
jgi:ribosome-binding factor A